MHSWIPPLSNTQVGKRVLLYIVIKEHCIYRIYGVNRFIEPISISLLLPDWRYIQGNISPFIFKSNLT